MPTTFISTRKKLLHRRRSGSILLIVVVLLVLLAIIAAVAWFTLWPAEDKIDGDVIYTDVFRGPYEHIVLEQGQVESAERIEIRCEVESSSAGGTEIKWVIDEGAQVVEGDKLVELNSADFEKQLVQQQIVCNTSEALVVQAENTLSAAEIARLEYLEGSFRQEEQLILSEIFVAEENLRRAQLAFRSTERLAAKGIVTALQLEGDQFAVDKARNELEAGQTKLEVLRKYTRAKMLKQFDSDIATASAKWGSEKESHKLEMEKLADIKEQIKKCIIFAPSPGQVVYANVYSRRGGSAEFVLEEGASVREGQELIRLPNRNEMQVKATINESRISLVRSDMPVIITLDAMKDVPFDGTVTKVNQYAEPGGWSSGNVKEYAAFISIDNPTKDIRSGMNAEVRIYVEREDNALQIPVQALYELKGHYFCLLKNGEKWETREVEVGTSNDSFMTIKKGLEEGEKVVMNPRGHSDKMDLPDLPDPEPAKAIPPGTAPVGAVGKSGGPPEKKSGGGAGGGNRDPNAAFARVDSNGDGTLTSDEVTALPGGFKDVVAGADGDGDGTITRQEFMSTMAKKMQEGGGRPPGAGGGGE